MSGNNGVPGRTVVTKATMILNAFAGDRAAMSLSDLARATGLPVSTVHRLASELVAWGGLERTDAGGYAVGIRLWEIAARSRRSHGLRETAMPFLQGLFDLTRQHVQLAVVEGTDALLIEKISAAQAVHTIGRAGGRLPLHASAVGKALLAWSPTDVQSRLLGSPLASYTPSTIVSRSALRRELAETRRRGFAIADEEMSLGAVSCAAPVLVGGPEAIAAVSVVTPAGETVPQKWSHAVMAAAFGIARAYTQHRPQPPLSARLTGRGTFPLDGTAVAETAGR
ncbi:IclR family transcriptional regulator [Actinomadura fibrosa]|uniref:IclR family transcriptional regulator n=1 Tax=Actinomadura fibrosa TaxID=111802 RepID=A0ABW2Y7S3_9ACTN|nr:IclR family transcriptional regulator [Actinomadura fibrosa]